MDNEHVILVDDDNNEIGIMPKLAAHHDKTPLHRAFSSYVFNKDGKFLLTQRAKSKKVWPGVWTNSCCGHLSRGESSSAAMKRRLKYELGLDIYSYDVALPHFRYRVELNGIVENEICPVFLVRVVTEPKPNPLEVEDYRYVDWDTFIKRVPTDRQEYAEWSLMQIKELRDLPLLHKYTKKI